MFNAELIDFKIVYNVLRGVNMQEYAILKPMEEGLKITLEEMKCTETSVYFPCNMFSLYELKSDEDISFKINLKVFTECLNIFGDDGNSSLKLSYKNPGAPLSLVMKHLEENIIVDCEINTFSTDDFPNISLAEECNLNKMVVNANIFQELLYRLDNSADEVNIKMSPDPPYFTLTATGRSGESLVTISKNSEEVFVYQCQKETEAQCLFSNLKQLLKILSYSSKISISMGETGLLGIQLVINSDEKQMYVEYYVTSLVTD
ncbi:cell cycle checkpoint protein RAD1-like [Harmonia axyridis]|uniref:cell cycle checkpoint protein RAD1-like n=1 Tax=Harmonia axyridis TaxID=115357 RepID=UPI001E278AFC|nr:cell cycle checkpoint protein RAD1-like [Harmonia axyridis]